MWTPTLVANPFSMASANHLIKPKPGEKRSFFTSKREIPKGLDYILDLAEKPMDFNTTPPFIFMGGFGREMPYQVPPMKMPPIVGGFVGAKSQSLREDSGKSLWEILADTFIKSIQLEQPTRQLVIQPNQTPKPIQKIFHPENISPNVEDKVPPNVQIEAPPLNDGEQFQIASNIGLTNAVIIPTETAVCSKSNPPTKKDENGKPPVKKPKLSIPTAAARRRGRRKGKKKCKKIFQCEMELLSPGYDPVNSCFESVDEVDCGIVLRNRFSPLEDELNYDMCDESPETESKPCQHFQDDVRNECHENESTDTPLLNMLNEMHLDDFEIEFESSSPVTELCDVHSYKRCPMDDTLTINSSISFILGGNDDITTSDSEDGSFASDLEETQWQTFKNDFEFFQEHMNIGSIFVGACDNSNFHFETSLEVLDNDDNFFLNELETDGDPCDKIKEVNQRWNQMMLENDFEKVKPTKVCFAPDCSLTLVHTIPSGPEERQARKSPWDQCYADRCRFQKRIKELEHLLVPCLTPQHRKSVFQRLYGHQEN